MSVFLESVGNSIQISLSLYTQDSPTTISASGQLLTLDDQFLSITLKSNTLFTHSLTIIENYTYYMSITQKQYMMFANYTLQLAVNCNLTLRLCYPYKVDAMNCVCNNVQQAPPYVDNTTIAEIVSDSIVHKNNNNTLLIVSVVGT